MRAIRAYTSSYSMLYKIIMLIAAPIICFLGILFGNLRATGDTVSFNFTYWSVLYAETEILTEFYMSRGLYKKSEPFGRMLLTSQHAHWFFKTFPLTGFLRRLIFAVAVFTAPAAISRGDALSILNALAISLFIVAVTTAAIYVNRNSNNGLIFVIVLMLSVFAVTVISGCLSIAQRSLFTAAICTAIFSCLSAVLGYLTVHFGHKRLERSFYYDKV